jgi:hypothetical protein
MLRHCLALFDELRNAPAAEAWTTQLLISLVHEMLQ